MTMKNALFTGAMAALALTGCSSAEPHFYTLVANPKAHPLLADPGYQLEVLPVEIPAQVDTPQLIVREAEGEIVPVDSRRWIAPLADEIRGAVSTNLSMQLGARDVYRLPAIAENAKTFQVKMIVERFDSMIDGSVEIDAVWTVRPVSTKIAAKPEGSVCTSRVSESAGGGYDGIARAHQRALAKIAASIGEVIRASATNPNPACPR